MASLLSDADPHQRVVPGGGLVDGEAGEDRGPAGERPAGDDRGDDGGAAVTRGLVATVVDEDQRHQASEERHDHGCEGGSAKQRVKQRLVVGVDDEDACDRDRPGDRAGAERAGAEVAREITISDPVKPVSTIGIPLNRCSRSVQSGDCDSVDADSPLDVAADTLTISDAYAFIRSRDASPARPELRRSQQSVLGGLMSANAGNHSAWFPLSGLACCGCGCWFAHLRAVLVVVEHRDLEV